MYLFPYKILENIVNISSPPSTTSPHYSALPAPSASPAPSSQSRPDPNRGFAWVWHNLTTSVREKAKKLLGAKQLKVMPVAGAGANESTARAKRCGWRGGGRPIRLRSACSRLRKMRLWRRTSLRCVGCWASSRDHGLVVSVRGGAQGGAEATWIPMRREALAKIVGELKAEGH